MNTPTRNLIIACTTVVVLMSALALTFTPSHEEEQPPATSTSVATSTTTLVRATTTTTSTSTTSTSTSTSTSTTITPGEAATAEYGQCTQYEPLLQELAPESGWDVQRMSRIMWKESRCQPELFSRTNDSGLLQINRINWDDLSKHFNVSVTREALYDPVLNIKSAAVLCEVWRRHGPGCYYPWGQSGE